MSNETLQVLEIHQGEGARIPSNNRPIRGSTKIIFGICCYMVFAAVYFLKPNKPVLSIGQLSYTVDALLELSLTFLSLPAFFLVYRYGQKTFPENLTFPVPEVGIELLVIISIIWISLSNGIHATSKLSEQIIAASSRGGSVRSVHYLRQVVGHVSSQIGWQMLFAALMLGQLKRPFLKKLPTNAHTLRWGIVFGLLFTQGAIAAGCITLGSTLTMVSFALFTVLALRSGLSSENIPVLRFFQISQVTFLVAIALFCLLKYWPR